MQFMRINASHSGHSMHGAGTKWEQEAKRKKVELERQAGLLYLLPSIDSLPQLGFASTAPPAPPALLAPSVAAASPTGGPCCASFFTRLPCGSP